MQFIKLAVLAIAVALSEAHPSRKGNGRSIASMLLKRKKINDCASSTFTGQTTDQSPLVSDCQSLQKNIKVEALGRLAVAAMADAR